MVPTAGGGQRGWAGIANKQTGAVLGAACVMPRVAASSLLSSPTTTMSTVATIAASVAACAKPTSSFPQTSSSLFTG